MKSNIHMDKKAVRLALWILITAGPLFVFAQNWTGTSGGLAGSGISAPHYSGSSGGGSGSGGGGSSSGGGGGYNWAAAAAAAAERKAEEDRRDAAEARKAEEARMDAIGAKLDKRKQDIGNRENQSRQKLNRERWAIEAELARLKEEERQHNLMMQTKVSGFKTGSSDNAVSGFKAIPASAEAISNQFHTLEGLKSGSPGMMKIESGKVFDTPGQNVGSLYAPTLNTISPAEQKNARDYLIKNDKDFPALEQKANESRKKVDELQKKDGELGKTIDEIKPKMTNGTAGAEEVKKFNDAVKEHGTVNGLLQMAKSEVKQAEQKQEEKIQEYVTFSKKNGPGGPPSNANPPAPTGPFK